MVLNRDSINKLEKRIHAREKAAALDVLFKLRVKNGFNGAMLVAQHNHVIYKNAAGFSNFQTKEPLSLNSQFQLASASKPFTATGILILKEQGKLSLNDTLQKYFPEFPYRGITIKDLLTHRSGLSNYVYFCEPYCDDKKCYNGKVFSNQSIVDVMVATPPGLYARPNKKFEYCNTNYALLALIIEKVSGLSYENFLKQSIFEPLNMNDTWVRGAEIDSKKKNMTLGHNGQGKIEKDDFADAVVGDKGIYSTVEDMFKWNQSFYSNKLLKKESIDEAFMGYSNEHKGKRNYGFGWRLIDNGKNAKIVYHNGWWHGYNTLFYRRLSDETCVVILSNKLNRGVYQIQDILSVLDEMDNQEESFDGNP